MLFCNLGIFVFRGIVFVTRLGGTLFGPKRPVLLTVGHKKSLLLAKSGHFLSQY